MKPKKADTHFHVQEKVNREFSIYNSMIILLTRIVANRFVNGLIDNFFHIIIVKLFFGRNFQTSLMNFKNACVWSV